MAPPLSVLSKTLHSITLTKIRELEKVRTKYETRKKSVLEFADKANDDQRERINRLLVGLKELLPEVSEERDIENITRSTDQSKYDASIPEEMLQSFENQLRAKFDIHSRRLSMADLYSQLLQEWIKPGSNDETVATSEGGDLDSFHVVERQKERLQELCDKFEAVVFEPLQTDEIEIDNYLRDLCSGEECLYALSKLRKRIGEWGTSFPKLTHPFDEDTLKWCINGLLAEDLMSDEKQSTLQDFLHNDVVLKEIADVLNMRFANIENWDWDAGQQGIPVMPRQQLNGKYRIWMDEDVLQAILTHYVSIKWCTVVRQSLKDFVQAKGVWKWKSSEQKMNQRESDRYQYYCSKKPNVGYTVAQARMQNYMEKFFLSQLPASTDSFYAGGGYDDDNVGSEQSKGKSRSTKQELLRKLAAEALLHQHIHGQAALIQSDLKWFATGLSHSTIFAILRFVGFPEHWIAFYKKYLQPMLNLSPASDEATPRGPRMRQRGLPMAHAAEKLIGELVLFFMDLAVNHEAGSLLYRLHDDLWLVGQPTECAKAWEAMNTFAKVMGLEFNESKTGSAYLTTDGIVKDSKIVSILPKGDVVVGFLKFDEQTGSWVIDSAQVDTHLKQLQNQLQSCDSVLKWIQTWNSCIGRFFGHTFGEPANCFGRKHVDSILETHKRIQAILFTGKDGKVSNLTQHLRAMISSRFGVSDIPDGFFYLPEGLGGLNVRNPFVPLLLVRDMVYEDPHKGFEKFFQEEREDYITAKKDFEELPSKIRQKRLKDNRDVIKAQEADTFFSLAEFTKGREFHSEALGSLYEKLMSVPDERQISISWEVEDALDDLRRESNLEYPVEVEWIAAVHAADVLKRCGDLRMVDQGYLPLGVLGMMRMKKVTWQMVL
jgi:hypothetical protein